MTSHPDLVEAKERPPEQGRSDEQARGQENVSPLAAALPAPQDSADERLRERLVAGDADARAAAALELGAAYLTVAPRAAFDLLRLAASAVSALTAGRALLRLARHAANDPARPSKRSRDAETWRLLQEAQTRTATPGGRTSAADPDMLALRLDIAVALAFLPRGAEAAVRVLVTVERALQEVPDPAEWGPPGSETHRRLSAFTQLRLGQILTGTAPREADRHLERAVALGTGPMRTRAALERARLLHHRADGRGTEVEDMYLLAVEPGDPTLSPQAALELADFLWENGRRPAEDTERPDDDPENEQAMTPYRGWALAAKSGDAELLLKVERRLSGKWQSERAAIAARAVHHELDLARPVESAMPTTELGRLATGRAGDHSGDCAADRKVIVIGAGTGGHYLLPALAYGYDIVGFVDDQVRDDVEGHKFLGTIERLPTLLEENDGVEQVIFAIPTAPGDVRLRVVDAVDRFNQKRAARVAVVSLPPMFELRHGHPLGPQLRPFEVHETLGRQQWLVDRQALRLVADRRVVIVGAGNALGSELARRVALARPRHLLLVDEPAVPLRDLTAEIRDLRGLLDCDERILDFAAESELVEVLRDLPAAPDVVFFTGGVGHASSTVLRTTHAARANVLAPHRVVEAAIAVGARDVVLASVDRAGHRVQEFDMTAALGEAAALMQTTSDSAGFELAGGSGPLRVSVLRLPNLWSRNGTVTGRLVNQLASGGPLRVKPSRRRFAQAWQAAQTMLRLLGTGHDGGVFALAEGEEIWLRTVAERLLLIHGLVAGRDIQIEMLDRPDTKSSLLLWGRDEWCGAEVVKGALRVEQDAALERELQRRAQEVVDALSEGRRGAVADLLDPLTPISDALRPKAIAG